MRRALYALRRVVYVLVSPLAFPILGAIVAYQLWARALGWRETTERRCTWYWRVWWFYGYHGLYQIDWKMKRRSAERVRRSKWKYAP